jgi:hypothetical protein
MELKILLNLKNYLYLNCTKKTKYNEVAVSEEIQYYTMLKLPI